MRQGSELPAAPELFIGFVGHRWNRLDRLDEPRLRQRLRQGMAAIDVAAKAAAQSDVTLIAGQADGGDSMAASERPDTWRLVTVAVPGGAQPDYFAQAQTILDRSDLLLALWDGLPGQGPGGTADSIARAVDSDIPVLWLDSGAVKTALRHVLESRHDAPLWQSADPQQLEDIVHTSGEQGAGIMTPRRILSIDGGGTRGVVAIAFLQALEARLKAEHGPDYRIRDHFDLIGGTSTGALLATGLALGKSPAALYERYTKLASKVFRRRWTSIKYLNPMFLAQDLERQIETVTGDRRLDTPDLRPGGLAIVTKRLDTGSVWFLTNNTDGEYWNSTDSHPNRHFRLSSIVRASTAAPVYFAPQRIEIVKGQPAGIFADGALTMHNNPAFALFQIATVPAYGYNWTAAVEQLDITSIGTGSFRKRAGDGLLSRLAAGFAIESLEAMIADCDLHVMTAMQILGKNETPWTMDSEVGDLAGVCVAPQPLFTFRRYNILLEQAWLKTQLGKHLTDRQLSAYRQLDNLAAMDPLYDLASQAAKIQMGAVPAAVA